MSGSFQIEIHPVHLGIGLTSVTPLPAHQYPGSSSVTESLSTAQRAPYLGQANIKKGMLKTEPSRLILQRTSKQCSHTIDLP